MQFTFDAYKALISCLKENRYSICNYHKYMDYEKAVVLRHDVDFSLEKALELAGLEYQERVTSTYFVLLSTNFYNIFSAESTRILKEMINLGHEIGLHFDESKYEINNESNLKRYVYREIEILSKGLNYDIKTVSMHRPSQWILDQGIEFENVINSYSRRFFNDFKYISDSRMFWREDVIEIIESNKYDKLHILTHPFWYSFVEKSSKELLFDFISSSKVKNYDWLNENIRDLESILKKEYI